jgi:hypothetical protein
MPRRVGSEGEERPIEGRNGPPGRASGTWSVHGYLTCK